MVVETVRGEDTQGGRESPEQRKYPEVTHPLPLVQLRPSVPKIVLSSIGLFHSAASQLYDVWRYWPGVRKDPINPGSVDRTAWLIGIKGRNRGNPSPSPSPKLPPTSAAPHPGADSEPRVRTPV